MLVIMSRIRPPLPNGNYPIIWEVIKKSADKIFNGNVLDAYIAFVLSYRSFKRDVDHQKIMMTVRRYQKGSDAMDFKEALLKADNYDFINGVGVGGHIPHIPSGTRTAAVALILHYSHF